MIYKQHIETPSYLCDIDDRLHPWAAIRLCQEVTEYHGNATGIGFKTLLQNNHAWVITRGLYNFYRLPDAFEEIDLSTWSRGNNGLIAMRDYRMLSQQGDSLLTGTSYWALIDMTSRRVMRLNNVIANYENHDIQATEHAELQKIKQHEMTEDDLVLRCIVPFAFVDHTRHMNNSEYVKLMFDVLHNDGFDTKRPFVLEVNYQLESRLGEQLSVFRKRVDDSIFIEIDNPRSMSVLARVAYL